MMARNTSIPFHGPDTEAPRADIRAASVQVPRICHGPLPCACESDVALPQSCQRDVPRSYFCGGSGDAVGRHLTQTFNFAVCFASACPRARHCAERQRRETSPPHILASGRGCCRAAGRVAHRAGASLSVAAGAHHRWISPGQAIDIVTRIIGQWLSERLGQQFIVENRPGAGGNIATEAVVRRHQMATRCSPSARII